MWFKISGLFLSRMHSRVKFFFAQTHKYTDAIFWRLAQSRVHVLEVLGRPQPREVNPHTPQAAAGQSPFLARPTDQPHLTRRHVLQLILKALGPIPWPLSNWPTPRVHSHENGSVDLITSVWSMSLASPAFFSLFIMWVGTVAQG